MKNAGEARGRPNPNAARVLRLSLLAVTLTAAGPSLGAAQLAEPCEAACAVVLGLSGYAVGTGALVAWGRHTGGISGVGQATRIWGLGFAVTVGAGFALSGNGGRQERAVYSAGLGVLAGSAVGLLIGSRRSEGSGARLLAAVLIGAGAGTLIGGVLGAVSYDDSRGPAGLAFSTVQLFSLTLPLE